MTKSKDDAELEAAAKDYALSFCNFVDADIVHDFKAGAHWQAARDQARIEELEKLLNLIRTYGRVSPQIADEISATLKESK